MELLPQLLVLLPLVLLVLLTTTTLIITAATSDMGSWGCKKNGMAHDTDGDNIGQIATCNNIWCAAP